MQKIIIILLLLLSPIVSNASDLLKIKPIDGVSLPEIAFKNKEGDDVYLLQFIGKPVILNFWATWCTPCIKEMPALLDASKQLDVQLITVSQDFGGMAKIIPFLKKHGLDEITPYHDPKNKLLNGFNRNGLPISFLIDSQGNVNAIIQGFINWHDDKILEVVSTYL